MSQHQTKPLLLVASVFLFVGAIVCMNDILLPSLKTLFHLTYTESTRVQQSFYIVYLFTPIPIALFIAKWGYKVSLLVALLITALGCALFLPAYAYHSFPLAMVALFIVAIGIALVNVAANPLAALLGDPEGAHARVNLVQVFSRLGFALTPVAATAMIYAPGDQVLFHRPYLWIGVGTLVMTLLVYFSRIPSLKPEVEDGFTIRRILKGARERPKLLWGAITMFFYIGADACTAGFFISYLTDPSVVGFDAEKAGRFLSYYYIVTTIVGFASIYLFRFFKAGRLVAIFATGMVALMLVCVFTKSAFNPYAMAGLGAFISILFPTIFSLGIEGERDFTEKGSALMNIAIVGGAIFPPIQGMVADAFGVQMSYIVPTICFMFVIGYGLYCSKKKENLPVRLIRALLPKNQLDDKDLAHRIHEFLISLREIDDELFQQWHETGWTKKEANEKKVKLEHDYLENLIKRNRDKKFPELGSTFFLWTGKDDDLENAQLNFSIGTTLSNRKISNVVGVSLPLKLSMQLKREDERISKIIALINSVWDPLKIDIFHDDRPGSVREEHTP